MLKALPPEILLTNPKNQLIEILTPFLFFVKICTHGKFFRRFRTVFAYSLSRMFFRQRGNFWEAVAGVGAVQTVQKSSKSELSSRFFDRVKFAEKFPWVDPIQLFFKDTKNRRPDASLTTYSLNDWIWVPAQGSHLWSQLVCFEGFRGEKLSRRGALF